MSQTFLIKWRVWLSFGVFLGLMSATNAVAVSPAKNAVPWSDRSGGVTFKYYHSGLRLRWEREGGDWIDAAGERWGGSPFARQRAASSDQGQYLEIDVSSLLKQWLVSGENPGFLLRAGKSTMRFRSREDATAPPLLHLSWKGVSKPQVLVSSRDTEINASTSKSLGSQSHWRVSGGGSALVGFDLSQFDTEQRVLEKAVLRLSLKKIYGKHGELLVYQVAHGSTDSKGLSRSQDEKPLAGIAASFLRDDGLSAHQSVWFFEDFETSEHSDLWRPAERMLLTNEQTLPGSERALKVSIKEGTRTGLNQRYRFENFGQKAPEQGYFRYYLRFNEDWLPVTSGGKLPGFAGTYDQAGWGSRRPVASHEGWSARGEFSRAARIGEEWVTAIGNYVYHLGQKGRFGDNWTWSQGGGAVLRKNRWYCVEQFVSLNQRGQNNGEIKAWLDGKLVFHKQGLEFRESRWVKLQEVWFNVYYGGTARSPSDQSLLMDNVVIAGEYIGPMKSLERRP